MVVETLVALEMMPVEQVVMASAITNNIFLSNTNRCNNHLAAMMVVEIAVALAKV